MTHQRIAALLEAEILRKTALASIDAPRKQEHLEVAEALKIAAAMVSKACEEDIHANWRQGDLYAGRVGQREAE